MLPFYCIARRDSRRWIPTNSQGIVNFHKWVRVREGDPVKLETAPVLTVEYEMSGNLRDWTCNVIRWEDSRNGCDPKSWYFLSFDNKPLEQLLEWYSFNKSDLTHGDVTRQVNLFCECLEEELNSDPKCQGNFYFHFFDDCLSRSMPNLINLIQKQEKKN